MKKQNSLFALFYQVIQRMRKKVPTEYLFVNRTKA